ncbi:MAG: cytochrome c oxidase subunit II [Thermoanaerobaculia bacterium]
MFNQFPILPRAASTVAPEVDLFYYFMVIISVIMTLLVAGLVIYFLVKYRRRPGNEIPAEYEPSKVLELGFIAVMFVVFMAMFFMSAKVYFRQSRPPDGALEIYVTGKQWMWKVQHPTGQSEIDSLHVPVGKPVKLIMSSEDVIHSFFIPAFRIKRDVLPNRYTYEWFTATKVGDYHLFCAEYCGTDHSQMIGTVHVMTPEDYQNWLAGGAPEGSPAAEGQKLFQSLACSTCHTEDSTGRCPVLVGLYGNSVRLSDGSVVKADENYLRESILNPSAKIVLGYTPIMPSFQSQVNEAQVLQLVAYIKSLQKAAVATTVSGETAGPGTKLQTETGATPAAATGSTSTSGKAKQ